MILLLMHPRKGQSTLRASGERQFDDQMYGHSSMQLRQPKGLWLPTEQEELTLNQNFLNTLFGRINIMLLWLLAVVFEKTIDPTNFTDLVQDKRPLVVRFSSEHRPRSVQLNEDWSRFEEMYAQIEDIRVGHVNCGKYQRLCLRENVWDPPNVKLYVNGTVFDYDGGMSYESLAAWTRRITGIQGNVIHLDLLSPNNRTFHELLATRKCVFVMFRTPWCRKCQRFMGAMKDIGKVFRHENVSICEVDTDKFKSFFYDYKIREFPAFRLFTRDGIQKYKGKLDKTDIIDYINDYCGTERDERGDLSAEAGLIDEVSPIVEDFMRKRSEKYIDEMNGITGTKIYTEIMKKILSDGITWLTDERERLGAIIASGNADQESLDKLKVRMNIISVFLSYITD